MYPVTLVLSGEYIPLSLTGGCPVRGYSLSCPCPVSGVPNCPVLMLPPSPDLESGYPIFTWIPKDKPPPPPTRLETEPEAGMGTHPRWTDKPTENIIFLCERVVNIKNPALISSFFFPLHYLNMILGCRSKSNIFRIVIVQRNTRN